jgi:hypothetical protein
MSLVDDTVYELFMNLLFELYGSSYPMIEAIPEIVCIGIESRNCGVGDFGNHDAVYRRHRFLFAIPVCPVQRVNPSSD